MLFFLAPLAVIAAMINENRAPQEIPPVADQVGAAAAEQGQTLPETRAERVSFFAAGWAASPDFAPAFNALDPSFDIAAATASAFDPADDYFGLPREGAYELVYGFCGSCHSLRIVMQQRATSARWDELLEWMVEKQGMAEPAPEDRSAMLAYLAKHFGSSD